MTTSSSFEIIVSDPERVLFSRSVDALAVPHVAAEPLSLEAAVAFSVRASRTAPDASRLRLRLGTEIVAAAPGGSADCASGLRPWLRDEFGESRIVLERATKTDRFEVVFDLPVAVMPRPEVARDFRVMIEDLGAVHRGLAQDVVGRSMLRGSFVRGPVALLYPEVLVAQLEALLPRLEHSLELISRQPSVVLDRTRRGERYRGGARIDARSAATAARDPRTQQDGRGRLVSVGKLLLHGIVVSEDLPEHRHIAEALRRMALRADALAAHCDRAGDLLQAEQARWGQARLGRISVFEQRDLPRLQALRELASRARTLAESFHRLLTQHRFLAQASPPRTPFGPTPAFLGRAAYRAVYRVLLESRQWLGVLVDAEEARLYHRNLATLYEYWCFLRTVAYLRERFGSPETRQSFSLIDDIYRPELAPCQEFRFAIGREMIVVATYQPEFYPWREARTRGERYGASLTAYPLRPDITLEVTRPERPPVLLVLDAKSTDAFSAVKLRDMADYSRQIIELETHRQPVRQVFLLHRDRETGTLCNLPGYLRSRQIDGQAMILGAVPCVPDCVGQTPPQLGLVIDRFLQVYAGVPPSGLARERGSAERVRSSSSRL
jgi:hypothetical protein